MIHIARSRLRSLVYLLPLTAVGIAAGVLVGKLYTLWPALS